MFTLLRKLLLEKIYICPDCHQEGELPQYLSLRETMDLPPYHPPAPPAARGCSGAHRENTPIGGYRR